MNSIYSSEELIGRIDYEISPGKLAVGGYQMADILW